MGKRIKNKVAEYREERGWTQEDLAEITGLNRVTISNIETGDSDPRISTIHKLCEALGQESNILFPRPTKKR